MPFPSARRPRAADDLQFFLLWLRRPGRMGAVLPSGRALAAAVAAQIDVAAPGVVVELGGGTGSITRSLLRAGVDPDGLIVVEREMRLCALISARFPGVRVICGDARDLERLLRDAGVNQVKTVVSGLPLLAMDGRTLRRILSAAFAVLAPGGEFLQFTYSPASPISRATRASLGIAGERSDWIFSNLPPAAIWRYRRRSAYGDLHAA